jgi:hypothetical protein
MAIPIPDDIRKLLQAPSYVHLSTPGDGSRVTGSSVKALTTNVAVRRRDLAAGPGARGRRRVRLDARAQPHRRARPAQEAEARGRILG